MYVFCTSLVIITFALLSAVHGLVIPALRSGSISLRATGSAQYLAGPVANTGALAVDVDAGRACLLGLNDCPDDQICVTKDENYGHCGPNPKQLLKAMAASADIEHS
ncbi:hypothetical protein DM01DRAFT_1371839 [Hesseltinella vesiculosa]|uniref:Uncharacterized protein n=1 Tax=Hesseltinella vesiculosa TaxID=101127 RepID=A0A1X2GQ18_9FUNG|nr:hypothetical protein DM01DRAFT_1371839 [Hesseltinella vesiculosa]